ncbi:MAG: hypothetical protein Q8R16_05405 [bacterium]|nr:hypothetical protein [bacterium]
MSDEAKTPVQQALEQPVFKERVTTAATILGVPEETLAQILVDVIGADTPALLERVSFQDLVDNVSGAKPAKVRAALDVLKGDGKSAKGEGGTSDLVKELRDESRLHELTGGRPLLCEHGGIEHSAANIRYFRKTGQAPKVCVYAGCAKLLASPKAEVSFEDGRTFLAPDGANPQTGRNEGKFSLADRALAHILIERRELSLDDAWRRLEDGSLRRHFSVTVAEIEAEDAGYANRLRKPFGGVRTGSMDPFHRPGHRAF